MELHYQATPEARRNVAFILALFGLDVVLSSFPMQLAQGAIMGVGASRGCFSRNVANVALCQSDLTGAARRIVLSSQ